MREVLLEFQAKEVCRVIKDPEVIREIRERKVNKVISMPENAAQAMCHSSRQARPTHGATDRCLGDRRRARAAPVQATSSQNDTPRMAVQARGARPRTGICPGARSAVQSSDVEPALASSEAKASRPSWARLRA